MPLDRAPSEASALSQPELIQALDRLSASIDIDGLLQALAETALALTGAFAVEIGLIFSGDRQLVSEYVLRADGDRRPLFPDIGRAQLTSAAMREAAPQLGFLTDLREDGVPCHVLVVPLQPGLTHSEGSPSPAGVVALGFAEAPALPPGFLQSLNLLMTRFGCRLQQFLDAQARIRRNARIDLTMEISGLVVQEGSSELLFNTAVRRIQEVFDLDTVALYAGKPLTLRLLYGGRTTRLGTLVPEGFAARVSRESDPVALRDLGPGDVESLPPWVLSAARSEVVLPLTYRHRRIGILDLYSTYAGTFDEVDLQILVTLARQLALLVVQERWDEPEEEPSHHRMLAASTGSDRGMPEQRLGEAAYDSEALQAAYDRLQEFAELKDQILQNISHELRTPLTLIKGYLELMLDGQMGALADDQRASLQMIVHKVDDVVRIVEEIVSLSPLNRLSVTYQRISVAELVAELALVFVQRTQGTGISWDFQRVDDDLFLSGDLAQIRQVFYNILDNSVKFSPEGGRIRVQAIPEQAYVHLIFQDEGIGIPKPRLTRIFETFYQVDGSSTRRFGGLGLGLAVVARVVKAHNGKVWAESELGKGSTFHVLLPKYLSPNQVFQPAMSGTR